MSIRILARQMALASVDKTHLEVCNTASQGRKEKLSTIGLCHKLCGEVYLVFRTEQALSLHKLLLILSLAIVRHTTNSVPTEPCSITLFLHSFAHVNIRFTNAVGIWHDTDNCVAEFLIKAVWMPFEILDSGDFFW